MKVTLWGTRGSLASAGPDTVRYGGNTSCVSVLENDSPVIVLDAGTGIRGFGQTLPPETRLVHIFLTHLHMDHVVGLPFFAPIYHPEMEVHIWGPASTTLTLEARIKRYLSPPLFPIRVHEIIPSINIHELPLEPIEIGEFRIKAEMILHPNPTVGYRIQSQKSTLTYLPDHEPALGVIDYPRKGEWISGFSLAEGADLLIHDSQYTPEEYLQRYGFGHSSIKQAFQFAQLSGVREFVPFHHDPAHNDDRIDRMIAEVIQELPPHIKLTPGKESTSFQLE